MAGTFSEARRNSSTPSAFIPGAEYRPADQSYDEEYFTSLEKALIALQRKLNNDTIDIAQFGSEVGTLLNQYLAELNIELTPRGSKQRDVAITNLRTVKRIIVKYLPFPTELERENFINGILAEHAVAEAFHQLGADVRLPNEQQDTEFKVDIWVRMKGSDAVLAIQVKSITFNTTPTKWVHNIRNREDIRALESYLSSVTGRSNQNLHCEQLLKVQNRYGVEVIPVVITVPSPNSSDSDTTGHNQITGEPTAILSNMLYNDTTGILRAH